MQEIKEGELDTFDIKATLEKRKAIHLYFLLGGWMDHRYCMLVYVIIIIYFIYTYHQVQGVA